MWSDWLVFCVCGFQSVCPLMEQDKSLWKLPDGRDWLRGKLGLFLMDRDMLNKSLIQFSVDGRVVFPPCCLTWDQTMVEVMKKMETSFKRLHAHTAALSAPDPAAGHHQPVPLLETPGHSQASLGQSLMGSLLLSPGSWFAQGFVCALQESVPPALCKFWGLYGVVNADLLQEAYGTPRSTASRAPASVAGHCWPTPLQETLKHLKAGLTQSLMCARFCLSPLSISGEYGVSF